MSKQKWKMMKGKRETPCKCAQPIRVKIIEPGIYKRRCEVCHQSRYFILELLGMTNMDNVLKLRWISDAEAAAYRAAQRADVLDVEVDAL